MKIALANDDQKTIASNFGRALGFLIFEFDNGKKINQEIKLNRLLSFFFLQTIMTYAFRINLKMTNLSGYFFLQKI